MSTPAAGQPTEEMWDAVTNHIATRLAERGYYSQVLAECTPAEQAQIEAALDRHAARQRAKGLPGW